MKRLILVFLSFFIMSSVQGMESSSIVASERESLLNVRELRFLIMQALFKATTLEDALRTSKAWCLVDKFGSTLLQSPTVTKDFIDYLEACSYETDLELSEDFLKNYSSLLDKNSYSSCVSSLKGRDELLSLFEESSKSSDWSVVSSKLAELKKNDWWKKIVNYYWSHSLIYNPDRKKSYCLVVALNYDAPLSFISELLESGARTTSFHPGTLPPLVYLFDELIRAYNKLYSDSYHPSYELDIEALSISEDPKEKKLKDLCDKINLLLKNKASLNDFFLDGSTYRSLPFLAASHHSLKLIEYLVKKGALFNSNGPLKRAFITVADPEWVGRKFAVLKALVEAVSDTKVLLRAFEDLLAHDYVLATKEKKTSGFNGMYTKEEFDYAIELLTNRLISQNASLDQKKEALLLARIYFNQETINLLVEKGFATDAESYDEKSAIRQECNERGITLRKLFQLHGLNQSLVECRAKEFFLYARDFLERNILEPQDIIPFFDLIMHGYLEEARDLLLCLSTKEPFFIREGEPASTVLKLIIDACSEWIEPDNSSRDFLFSLTLSAYALVCSLMEKGVQDTAINGKTAAQHAYDSGFHKLGDCITYKLQDWMIPALRIERDEEKVKLHLLASINNLIAQGQANIVGMGPLFPYYLKNFHLQEAKDFLSWAVSQEPFCLKGITYGDASSVFQVIVAVLALNKQGQALDGFLETFSHSQVSPVIDWLKGLGECITYKLQDWLTPLIESGPDEEKIKQLFVATNDLITQGQANIVGVGPLFPYALMNFHLQEAKDFLSWAVSQEPFCLKEIAYGDASSVFHVIVEFLARIEKEQPVDVFLETLSKVRPVIDWLKEQRVLRLFFLKDESRLEWDEKHQKLLKLLLEG